MRLGDNGRAVHPKVRPSSLRHYTLDEETTILGAIDMARAQDAQPIDISPAVVEAPTGRARRFFESQAASLVQEADDESRDAGRGEWTIGILMRLHSAPASAAQLFSLGGDDDSGLADDNELIGAWIDADRIPQMTWQHDAGDSETNGASTYVVPLYQWTYLVWRKSAVDLDAGTCTLGLYVNGHKVDEFTDVANADGGADAAWRIGHLFNGTVPEFCPNADIAGCYAWAEALSEDEIIDDVRRMWLLPFFARADLQVIVTDDDAGLAVDLTDHEGIDWVDKAEITHSNDDPCATANITLMREVENLSLAVLRTDSKLNLTDVEDRESYASLIKETRAIELMSARVPLGINAVPMDFMSVFKGSIDEVEQGGPDTMVLHCRDQAAVLIDTWIEEVVRYGDPGGAAVEGEMQYVLNDNDDDDGNDSVPGLVERVGSYAPIALYTPKTPSWAVKEWKQRRESVNAALRALGTQIAWEVGYVFDENPNDPKWRLTFFDPDRARVDVDACVLADDVIDIPEMRHSIFGVRNVVRVPYPSSETSLPTITPPAGYVCRIGWNNVDGEGARMMAYVEVESTASIAAFGRRFMEMAEPSGSQIDSSPEGFSMSFGALRDLEEPDINQGLIMPMVTGIGVMNILKIGASILNTVAQRLAIKSTTQTFDDKATSRFQLRGKPAIGWRRWLHLETRQGEAGSIKPDDCLADTTTTNRLTPIRSLIERTALMKGGKFIALRNPAFESFSGGMENTPDAWGFIDTSDFGTDADESWGAAGDFYVESTSLTGARSLIIQNDDVQKYIVSDFVPVNGDADKVFTIETVWLRKSGALSAYGVNVVLLWYDAAKVYVASSSSVFTDGGSTTPDVWFAERKEGIAAPGGASYVRVALRISQAGPNAVPVLVDNVNVYNCGHELFEDRFADQATAGVPAGGHDKWENVQWDAVHRNYGNVRPTPAFAGAGNGFIAKEPGIYTIDGAVGLDTPNANNFAAVRLVKNASYNAAGHHVTGSGLVVWTGVGLPLCPKNAVGLVMAGVDTYANVFPIAATVRLERGDVLQAEWYSDNSDVSVIGTVNIHALGSVGGSNWDVKQKLAD